MLGYTILKNDSTSQWLTLVHGASASASIWKYQIEFFKKYYNIVILDFNGYTENDFNLNGSHIYSIEFIAKEVIELLDKEQIKSSHFVGASLGNLIIRQILEEYPEMVNGVVMTSAILNINFMFSMVLYAFLFLGRFVPHKYLYSVSVAVSFPMPCNKLTRELFLGTKELFSKEMYRLWLRMAKENFALMHFFNLVGLRSEVLFINGNQDYMFLPFVKKFVKENDSAKLKIIEKSGHGVNIDKKDIYNKAVLTYLRRVESKRRVNQGVYESQVDYLK
ncbi:alpha/beta hydrolase [Neptunitalea chrysea]|uniref:Alpha/beta hydrolase n=1 Tax=Neptunitalea chrysea TaxID=1647581 RepID=A0A9W6B945_9FLAO|nr:alpha/beta hydrolase [Neptunitalea chrysea]GLB53879.1 alpha/beta hydrolase [Neptunitalea chrysea]